MHRIFHGFSSSDARCLRGALGLLGVAVTLISVSPAAAGAQTARAQGRAACAKITYLPSRRQCDKIAAAGTSAAAKHASAFARQALAATSHAAAGAAGHAASSAGNSAKHAATSKLDQHWHKAVASAQGWHLRDHINGRLIALIVGLLWLYLRYRRKFRRWRAS